MLCPMFIVDGCNLTRLGLFMNNTEMIYGVPSSPRNSDRYRKALPSIDASPWSLRWPEVLNSGPPEVCRNILPSWTPLPLLPPSFYPCVRQGKHLHWIHSFTGSCYTSEASLSLFVEYFITFCEVYKVANNNTFA